MSMQATNRQGKRYVLDGKYLLNGELLSFEAYCKEFGWNTLYPGQLKLALVEYQILKDTYRAIKQIRAFRGSTEYA